MRSMQYAIYKGKGSKSNPHDVPKWGAAQFNLAPSHFYCEACKAKNYTGENHPNTGTVCNGKMQTREGCVFVEMTSPSAPDVYDWANKIIMALSVTDLGKLLVSLRTGTELKLLHDPGAGSDKMGLTRKTLNFISPNGLDQGGILTAGQTTGDDKKMHKVPLSGDEVLTLAVLIQTAISRCLCW